MKKRIMAFLLVLAMAVSMVACGSGTKESSETKTADVTALFNKVDGMESRTTQFVMDIDASAKESTEGLNSIKLGLKVDGFSQDDKKSQATISYKLGDSSEYKALTTVVGDNTTAYIDFATLKTAAVDICNTYNIAQAAAVISVLPEVKYLKVDADTLSKYISTMSGTTVDTSALKDADSAISEKVVRTVVEYVMKSIQDATKEVSPALISGSDSELKISVTKENLEAATDAILKLDLAAKYDEMVTKVKEIGSTDKYVTELTNSKQQVVTELKNALNEVKNEKDDFDAFNIEGSLGVSGDKGTRKVTGKISVNVEQKSEKVVMNMEMTCGEEAAKDSTVTIPSDATDFTEYMTQLSSTLGF